jgi:Uma2 family endonuclease
MAQQLVRSPITDQPPRMTYEEFLDWATGHPHAEWVDGEVIEFMTVKGRHALVVYFLVELIKSYVRYRRLGLVLGDPYAMLIRGGRSSRQPDILVLLNDHLDRFTENRLEGPADLVVEVISEDSVTRDRDDKLAEYAAAGVPEYWIVEGRKDRTGCELFVLNSAGTYTAVAPDAAGRLHSTVLPGFWIDPAWLAEDPLPDLDWVLDELAPGIHLERAERARQERLQRQAGGSPHR